MNTSSLLHNFGKQGVQPKFLVTIVLNRGDFTKHPAVLPRSILASTDGEIVKYNDKQLYYAPTLFNFPDINEEIVPHQRKMLPKNATISISQYAKFPDELVLINGANGVVVQIDLWFPGTTLEEAMTIFKGVSTSVVKDQITGTVTITAEDGEPTRQVEFPPANEKLDPSIFSQIPGNVNGRYSRRVILGTVRFPLPCPQVDNGNTFYVCDHPISTIGTPIQVEVDGMPKLANDPEFAWSVNQFELPVNRSNILSQSEPLSVIKFKKTISPGLPFITVSNFSGYRPNRNPIISLLKDFGAYQVNQVALEMMTNSKFTLSVLNQASGSTILDLVQKRLIPQTNFISGFSNGEFVLYDLPGRYIGGTLEVGKSGLYAMADGKVELTDESDIINNLEIGYTRNVFSEGDFDMTAKFIRINKDNCLASMKEKLALSHSKYGSKYFRMDFPDLDFAKDSDYRKFISIIGNQIINLTYQQHRVFKFHAPWYPAFKIPLNSILRVNAPQYFISNLLVRLVGKQYKNYGFILKFQEEF